MVIILHWGSVDTTARCLLSLRDVVYTGKRTVLVIDDSGGRDGDVAALAGPLEVEIHRPARLGALLLAGAVLPSGFRRRSRGTTASCSREGWAPVPRGAP